MFCAVNPTSLIALGAAITTPIIAGTVIYALRNDGNQTYLLVSCASTSITQPTDEIAHNKDKNYKCTYNNKEDLSCLIEEVSVDTSKKWTNLTQLNSQSNTAVNKSTLKTANKFFRVLLSDEMIKSIDLTSTTNKLTISSTKSSETNKDYGSFTPLFMFNSQSAKSKNDLFLVKAKNIFPDTQTSPLSISQTDTTPKCVLNEADLQTESKHKECKIYQFATNQPSPSTTKNFSNLSFSWNSTASTSINKDHYYLVEFTAGLSTKEVNRLNIFYAAKSTTGSPSTWSKLIEFSPILKAVKSGATGSESLFILI